MRISDPRSLGYILRASALLATVCLPLTSAAQGFKFLELKVVDPDGKPMQDVVVDISIDGMEFPMPTNEEGVVALNIPDGGSGRVQVSVKHGGYVAQGVSWNKGETVPEEFTVPMKKGVPIGGIVHDEEGNPIEGVKVEGIMVFDNSTQLPGKGKLQPYFNGELATTGSDGRWRIDSAPQEPLNLQLRFSHPKYISDQGYGFRGGTWEELLSLEKVVVMEKGLSVTGTVVDAGGKPVSGAKVGLGDGWSGSERPTGTTDSEGKFEIFKVSPGSHAVTVYAPGHAPELQTVTVSKEMKSVGFKLPPPQKIAVRVVDPRGNPIAGAGIGADTWRGHRSLEGLVPRGRTDSDGMWVWDSAPADSIHYDIYCQGHMSVREQHLTAREEPYEIVMPDPVEVSGTVVDAETGQPIKTFSVINGIKWDSNNQPYYWERYNIKAGQDGKFNVQFDEPRGAHLVRIEADGYRPAISREIKNDEGKVSLEFKLEKGAGPKGLVKNPDGTPAAGVQIALAVANNNGQIYISGGKLQRQSDEISVVSDQAGRFELPFPEADFRLVCLGDAGWAEEEGRVDSDNLEITLQPWAKLEGVVLQGDKPLANEQVNLSFSRNYEPNRPNIFWSYQAITDAEGKFLFDRVKSGPTTVGRIVEYANRGRGGFASFSHTEFVDLKNGKTAQVQLGGKGRTIKGQVKLPKGNERQVDWSMGGVQMYERPAGAAGPQNLFHALGRAIARSSDLKTATRQTPQSRFNRSYAATFDDQGNYEIADVVPGTYQFSVQLYQMKGDQIDYNPVGRLSQVITVPEGEEVFAMEGLELQMVEPQPVQPGAGTATLQFVPFAPAPAE